MAWNLDDYEPVEDRLAKFWEQHPNGKVLTELAHHDDKRFIVKAYLWRGAPKPIQIPEGLTHHQLPHDHSSPDATGYAEELVGSTPVNKTSALENCETSAIGRALANLGYAAKGKRPSREEMAKVAGRDNLEQQIDEARNFTDLPQSCPDCGSDVYDNRDQNRQRQLEGKKNLPAFKCKNKACGDGDPWIAWEPDFFNMGTPEKLPVGGDVPPPPEPRDDFGPEDAPF